MDGTAVKKIEEIVLKNQKIVDENGVIWVNDRYRKLRQIDRPETLEFNTLVSLVDFINQNPHSMNLDKSILVINGNMSVSLLSGIEEEDNGRTIIAHAESFKIDTFPFDRFMSSEMFNIALQTRFVYDSEAQDLFGITSTVRTENEIIVADDGLSSNLTVRKGTSAASEKNITIKNRKTLKPYRIFPEVEQPSSEFLLRINGDEGAPSVGLWETDGGMWKVQAKKNIKAYLESMITTVPVYA